MKEAPLQLLEKIEKNQKLKHLLAFENPLWFSLLYLRHHFEYPFAPFHMEMFHLIENDAYDLIVVTAFRESGKSTVLNTAQVLWSILGRQNKKFVVIISKTQEQAKNHFSNIKNELENNERLREDFGPFVEGNEEWKKLSLDLVYRGSKILSVTRDESIRGLRHGNIRPDLIICDDLEDISAATNLKESAELYQRFRSEIMPLGSSTTRIVVLGNILSKESLIMRLKKDILQERAPGNCFRIYPIFDANGKTLWPQKFPTIEVINKLRLRTSNEAWAREYLIDVFNEEDSREIIRDDGSEVRSFSVIAEEKMVAANKVFKKELHGDRRYGRRWQSHLIQQMHPFAISMPEPFLMPPEEDPRYKKYKRTLKEIGKWYDDTLEEWYRKCIGKEADV